MNRYSITLKHDTGTKRIKLFAQDKDTANMIIMEIEKCPPSAIISTRRVRYVRKGEKVNPKK